MRYDSKHEINETFELFSLFFHLRCVMGSSESSLIKLFSDMNSRKGHFLARTSKLETKKARKSPTRMR